MRKPSEQQIDTAILWLENNEGDEAADCKAVAAWLAYHIKKDLRDKLAKSIAKQTGAPMAVVRERLRHMEV